MPLTFSSLSHGTVAFGFFNIETDALLLDRLFFFCTDFCAAVCELEGARGTPAPAVSLAGYAFDDPSLIGDLLGAIHGTRHEGYLGEVYRRWPFPSDPEQFRQRLSGAENRDASEALLRVWSRPTTLPVTVSPPRHTVSIGPYRFSSEGYLQLLAYVWRGGYPTWEGFEQGRRPACVTEMARAVGEARLRSASER